MNEQQVVELMKSSKSEAEWNAHLDKVRAAFSGQYPDFWYSAIIASGVETQTATSFGGSADIKVTGIARRPLDLYSRPTSMPYLKKGEQVLGVYDQGLGEKESACNSLEDMQKLYDSYAAGYTLTLRWFILSSSTTKIPV